MRNKNKMSEADQLFQDFDKSLNSSGRWIIGLVIGLIAIAVLAICFSGSIVAHDIKAINQAQQ